MLLFFKKNNQRRKRAGRIRSEIKAKNEGFREKNYYATRVLSAIDSSLKNASKQFKFFFLKKKKEGKKTPSG